MLMQLKQMKEIIHVVQFWYSQLKESRTSVYVDANE